MIQQRYRPLAYTQIQFNAPLFFCSIVLVFSRGEMEGFQFKAIHSVVTPELRRKIVEHLNNMKRLVLVKVAIAMIRKQDQRQLG